MRITIATVGRLRRGSLHDLTEDYLGRLNWPCTVREVEERRSFKGTELKDREGRLLLAAVPEGARTIALDQRATARSSEDFASFIAGCQQEGIDLAFLIGGAEGLSEAVRASADQLLSLGPMTWPHLLVRAMLAEQLFRAQAILSGHPYHRAG